MKVITKPSTPHNTGQFIINKFNYSQKQDDTDYYNNDIDIVDFCYGLNMKIVLENEQCSEKESDVKRARYMSTDINNNIDHEYIQQSHQQQPQNQQSNQNAKENKNDIDVEIDNMLSLQKYNSSFFDTDNINLDEDIN